MSHTLMLEDWSSGAGETAEALRQESGMLPILRCLVSSLWRWSWSPGQNTARCAEPLCSFQSSRYGTELGLDGQLNRAGPPSGRAERGCEERKGKSTVPNATASGSTMSARREPVTIEWPTLLARLHACSFLRTALKF